MRILANETNFRCATLQKLCTGNGFYTYARNIFYLPSLVNFLLCTYLLELFGTVTPSPPLINLFSILYLFERIVNKKMYLLLTFVFFVSNVYLQWNRNKTMSKIIHFLKYHNIRFVFLCIDLTSEKKIREAINMTCMDAW
jgi:hypothetical protein